MRQSAGPGLAKSENGDASAEAFALTAFLTSFLISFLIAFLMLIGGCKAGSDFISLLTDCRLTGAMKLWSGAMCGDGGVSMGSCLIGTGP